MRSGWLCALLLSSAGCAAMAGDSGTGPGPSSSVVQAALADAARRSGEPASALVVVSAERVVWRDGSLGCPRPGMNYTQALVPGYRVWIRARDRMFDYHSGLRGAPILCPDGQAVDPLPDDSR
jgi:hypothetical protein